MHQDDEAGSHMPANAHSIRSGIEMSPIGWGQGMGHLVCVVGTPQDAGGLLPGGQDPAAIVTMHECTSRSPLSTAPNVICLLIFFKKMYLFLIGG